MLNNPRELQNHLFALSNLIASFGGGTILGKGIKVIDNHYLQEGSLLAFFVGIVIGLIFLKMIPKNITHYFLRSFSFVAAFISILLIFVFSHYQHHEKLIGASGVVFFLLLSIRFGLWFFSRALRASYVAAQKQSLAWVELGYYLGMILGLIFWQWIDITLIIALLIDSVLQCIAAFFDLYTFKLSVQSTYEGIDNYHNINRVPLPGKYHNPWKLTASIVFLTIAVQAVILSRTPHFSDYFSADVVATFYLGAAVAAMFSKKLTLKLAWNEANHAIIYLDNHKKYDIHFIYLNILIIFSVIISICYQQMLLQQDLLYLLSVFISAFIYEILALVILDRIGLEEKVSKKQGILLYTYGIMGIGVAIALWAMEFINSWHILALIFLICIGCSLFLVTHSRKILF